MTYRETLRYLDSFVNYETRCAYPYAQSFKLERIRAFLARIGNPQNAFPSIHVAGTKGKGSVCAFCSSILRESGVRVGLYTSPHLHDVRERIRILDPRRRDGTVDFEGMISKEHLRSLIRRLKPQIDAFCASAQSGPLSFFEVYTALALAYFKEQNVECAVLETGIGGRLDATNVVAPVACGITSISVDHTQTLGNTLSRIAQEKAGIIKPRAAIVVSAPQQGAVRRVIEEKCRQEKCRLYSIGREIRICRAKEGKDFYGFDFESEEMGAYRNLAIRLRGRHQLINAACAIALAVCAGRRMKHGIRAAHIRNGLKKTVWPGRFEIIDRRFVLDGAHNEESARALARTLRGQFPRRAITVILGASRDKKLAGICRQLRTVSRRFIATRADNPRAFPPAAIAARLKAQDPRVRVSLSNGIADAFTQAVRGNASGICCVTGSLFLVGEARAALRARERNGKG